MATKCVPHFFLPPSGPRPGGGGLVGCGSRPGSLFSHAPAGINPSGELRIKCGATMCSKAESKG